MFATPWVTVYAIRAGRGFAQSTEILPASYGGTLVRDGWAPYRSYSAATHQTCLAHLARRCRHLKELLPARHWLIPDEVGAVISGALALRDRRDAG